MALLLNGMVLTQRAYLAMKRHRQKSPTNLYVPTKGSKQVPCVWWYYKSFVMLIKYSWKLSI